MRKFENRKEEKNELFKLLSKRFPVIEGKEGKIIPKSQEEKEILKIVSITGRSREICELAWRRNKTVTETINMIRRFF